MFTDRYNQIANKDSIHSFKNDTPLLLWGFYKPHSSSSRRFAPTLSRLRLGLALFNLGRNYCLAALCCWAHARRKFVEAAKVSGNNKKSTKAEHALKLIAKLYIIEKEIKDESADVRYKRRQQDSKEIINKLRTWWDQTRSQVAPKLALGKALHYLDHQWLRLVAYLDDGNYPIDNNVVENAIRPFAIGRKNWLFSNSVEGTKANGLEPYAYLKQVFNDLPNFSTYDDVDRLLPNNVNDDVALTLTK